MGRAFLVFPHQLFRKTIELLTEHQSFASCYVVEDALIFAQHKFHIQKLVMHRASMKAFVSELEAASSSHSSTIAVRYLDASKVPDMSSLAKQLAADGISVAEYFDPVDDYMGKRLKKALDKQSIAAVIRGDTPAFMCSTATINAHFASQKGLNAKRFLQHSFYIEQRKMQDVLMTRGQPRGGQWSFDEMNRCAIDEKGLQKLTDPSTPAFLSQDHVQHTGFVQEALEYVKTNFPESQGEVASDSAAFAYPVTRAAARGVLQEFLAKRFKLYGKYQDAMTTKHDTVFHSLLSPPINVGLLTPQEVVDAAIAAEAEFKIPIEALEGFIRQVIGWREFIRGLYVHRGVQQRNGNFFNATRKLPKAFYTGTTGLVPLDDAIKKTNRTCYLHHIERLMVVGNAMILCQIRPDDVYLWFMELFIDAYDWVMVPNVYGMSQFADGGLMATKPYISGSAYILKMSDYKKPNPKENCGGTGHPWTRVWDALYWNFIGTHNELLRSNPRMAMITATWRKMDSAKQNEHLKIAKMFLDGLDRGECHGTAKPASAEKGSAAATTKKPASASRRAATGRPAARKTGAKTKRIDVDVDDSDTESCTSSVEIVAKTPGRGVKSAKRV